jgi:hypothetical protein
MDKVGIKHSMALIACLLFFNPINIFTSDRTFSYSGSFINSGIKINKQSGGWLTDQAGNWHSGASSVSFSPGWLSLRYGPLLFYLSKPPASKGSDTSVAKSVDYEHNFSNDVYENFKLLFTRPLITYNNDFNFRSIKKLDIKDKTRKSCGITKEESRNSSIINKTTVENICNSLNYSY